MTEAKRLEFQVTGEAKQALENAAEIVLLHFPILDADDKPCPEMVNAMGEAYLMASTAGAMLGHYTPNSTDEDFESEMENLLEILRLNARNQRKHRAMMDAAEAKAEGKLS